MAGAVSQSLTGMLYVGPWEKESTVTTKRHSSQEWHVCVKEIKGKGKKQYKRIVAILESAGLAWIVAGMLLDPLNKPLLNALTKPHLPGRVLNGAQKKKPASRRKN